MLPQKFILPAIIEIQVFNSYGKLLTLCKILFFCAASYIRGDKTCKITIANTAYMMHAMDLLNDCKVIPVTLMFTSMDPKLEMKLLQLLLLASITPSK